MLLLFDKFINCEILLQFKLSFLCECILRGENQKGISDIFGEMQIYIYIYQMKALNELILLTNVLSSMCVQICIINNWNQYTKSDQTMVQLLFWLSCKVGEMSCTPFWLTPLDLIA